MSDATRTIGQLAQLACTWEVLARKAGNVCPGREFPDLTVNDFLRSAAAIAPVLDHAPFQPLGVTILRCVEETRKVVTTNTNLGIVLLLAPLASVPLDRPLCMWDVLSRTTVEDSRHVYAAIRLAIPGGLGAVQEQDIRDEPTWPLREVMGLAMDRDLIAAQYADDFVLMFDLIVPELLQQVAIHRNIERAIVATQIRLLAILGDSLIGRKLGALEEQVQQSAQAIGDLDMPGGRKAYLDFDALLRADNHARNPGTTADLIAAALFVALRENQISPDTPFVWEQHPFHDS